MSAPFDRMVGEDYSLAEAALLIRRAGLEHLSIDPTPQEMFALAEAGHKLDLERAALLAFAIRNPGEAAKPFDGGALERSEIKSEFLGGPKRG